LYLTYSRGTNLADGADFQAQLRGEIERARRRNEQFTAIFLYVDDFKRINDVYGHRLGDESLKLLADALRSNARPDGLRRPPGG
jgi:diguanylate cyclase (GGDEF)-like protein